MDIKWNSIKVAPPKPGDYYGLVRLKGLEKYPMANEFCRVLLSYTCNGHPATHTISGELHEAVPPNSWILSDYYNVLDTQGYLDPNKYEAYWLDYIEPPTD